MSTRVLPGNTKGSAGDQICLHSTQKEIRCLLSSSIIYTRAPSLHFSVALLLFLLCFSTSTLCFSSSAPPRFLLALHRPEQHGARARLPGSPAARPGLARRGAGHGGVVRRGGEGAGLQGAQRAAVQHGPGPAERSQASHRAAHRQGWRARSTSTCGATTLKQWDTVRLLIHFVAVQMLPELRRYIQHISLSPDSINNDDVSGSGFLHHSFFYQPCSQPQCLRLCAILPGCVPSYEVLTRHYGHPDWTSREGESYQVITSSSSSSLWVLLHLFSVWQVQQHVFFCYQSGHIRLNFHLSCLSSWR